MRRSCSMSRSAWLTLAQQPMEILAVSAGRIREVAAAGGIPSIPAHGGVFAISGLCPAMRGPGGIFSGPAGIDSFRSLGVNHRAALIFRSQRDKPQPLSTSLGDRQASQNAQSSSPRLCCGQRPQSGQRHRESRLRGRMGPVTGGCR